MPSLHASEISAFGSGARGADTVLAGTTRTDRLQLASRLTGARVFNRAIDGNTSSKSAALIITILLLPVGIGIVRMLTGWRFRSCASPRRDRAPGEADFGFEVRPCPSEAHGGSFRGPTNLRNDRPRHGFSATWACHHQTVAGRSSAVIEQALRQRILAASREERRAYGLCCANPFSCRIKRPTDLGRRRSGRAAPAISSGG